MVFFICQLAHLLMCTNTYGSALQLALCAGGSGSVYFMLVCVCAQVCIKFTFLYSCMGMGMWMHHGVGDGYVDAPWSGWWCILALFSLVPPPPPVSTAQSTHTRAPNTLSVCPPLSEATSCE